MRTCVPAALLVLAAAAACGCVERKLIIQSNPSGAPVWVDERYAGVTPLDYPFAHYGTRAIRVGPIRDENGRLTYHEQERVFDIDWPYYETFPIDFFYEVLYPRTLVDEHRLPVFELRPATGGEAKELSVEELKEEGEAFRRRALTQVPETPAEE